MTMPNPRSQLHRLEPIRKSLAERWKSPILGLKGNKKNSYLGFKPRKLRYAITPQMGLLANVKADPQFKSP